MRASGVYAVTPNAVVLLAHDLGDTPMDVLAHVHSLINEVDVRPITDAGVWVPTADGAMLRWDSILELRHEPDSAILRRGSM